ncbi:hypothetical protein DP117_10385 [Brasilonema sp. UFV-L1]|nr:hypothetical protein [Brasilonema sp. UFV-L1]
MAPLFDTKCLPEPTFFAYASKGINYLQHLLTKFLDFYVTLQIPQKRRSSNGALFLILETSE